MSPPISNLSTNRLVCLTSTTPSAPSKEASRHLLDVAATPPRLRRGIQFCCGFAALWFLAFADLRSDWDSLVEAERAFARTSLAKGTKEAFLSALAENSVLFRPRAVNGRKWMQDNPAPAGQLNWAPEFADISRAGDLGYTTGPWEFRKTPQDPPGAFGHYVTMWRKQANAAWKAELDNGISHERAPQPTNVASPPLPKEVGKAASRAEADKAKAALQAADQKAPASLASYFADDVRLYRDGNLPYVGLAAARKRLAETPGTLTGSQVAVMFAASADLGYTYGSAEFKPQDASKDTQYANYLRIWKKQPDGSWKIVLDELTPVPKP